MKANKLDRQNYQIPSPETGETCQHTQAAAGTNMEERWLWKRLVGEVKGLAGTKAELWLAILHDSPKSYLYVVGSQKVCINN
jgi:hypothetical protein